MAISADMHMHSHNSTDSVASVRQMIDGALRSGLDFICFTDHDDKDFPTTTRYTQDHPFTLDIEKYKGEAMPLIEEYRGRIEVGFGIEVGFQPHLARWYTELVDLYPFDFVIASSHSVCRMDVIKAAEEAETPESLYKMYFGEILQNLSTYGAFDVYGHFDYPFRYAAGGAFEDPMRYYDELSAIAKKLAECGKGFEINTAGLRRGLKGLDIYRLFLKLYRGYGGEIVTVGSDAHTPCDIGAGFAAAQEVLSDCGVNYYCTFRQRKPIFNKIK